MKRILFILSFLMFSMFACSLIHANEVACSVTDRLIIITNGRTTLRVSNHIGFSISFNKQYQTIGAPSSIYITDINNRKIYFNRLNAYASRISDEENGKGKSVYVKELS